LARCVDDFYETHPVVNNKLLSIRVFYRRIICLSEKNNENDATGTISTRSQVTITYLYVVVARRDP
jgi:hypothetical protein